MQTWLPLKYRNIMSRTKGGVILNILGLKIKGMVERLNKNPAQIKLHPPCCGINYDARRVETFYSEAKQLM